MADDVQPLETTDHSLGEQNGKALDQAEKQARKRSRSQINYPPYVSGYGSISELFEKISQAAVPPKFTQDFMKTVLGMKSSSHRALIPLLKKLGFLDQSNIPTEAYRLYRDASELRR